MIFFFESKVFSLRNLFDLQAIPGRVNRAAHWQLLSRTQIPRGGRRNLAEAVVPTTDMEKKMTDTMGARIEQARLTKGLNVTQLSRRVAVKPSTLKNWEADRSEPRANKMAMVAGILGVSVQWLLEGGDEMPEFEEQLPGSVKIAKKLELALALQQRLSQLLFELESDVSRMQHDWAEESNI